MNNSTIKNAIVAITTGTPQEVKQAQKVVDRFWHTVYIPHREEGKNALSVFLDELETFDEISDADHKSYFINTLKWALFSLGEEHFDTWAAFFLRVMQHPSGKVREAAIRAIDWMIMDIHIFLDPPDGTTRDAITIKRNRIRFCHFVYAIELLCERYYEKRYSRCKYVSSLPSGIYKSLQRLLTEGLLRSDRYRKIYEDFLKENEYNASSSDRDRNYILPMIQLKHFNKNEHHEIPRTPGTRCVICARENISIRSMGQKGTVCEQCTIDEYQCVFGIPNREAAIARRRRIFDIGYLFTEMYMDAVLQKRGLSSVDDLGDMATFNSLFQMAQNEFNVCFSKKEKIELEESKNQSEIERRFQEVINHLVEKI